MGVGRGCRLFLFCARFSSRTPPVSASVSRRSSDEANVPDQSARSFTVPRRHSIHSSDCGNRGRPRTLRSEDFSFEFSVTSAVPPCLTWDSEATGTRHRTPGEVVRPSAKALSWLCASRRWPPLAQPALPSHLERTTRPFSHSAVRKAPGAPTDVASCESRQALFN